MKMDNSGWHFQDLLIYLFGGLVHLYPPGFRAEFSDEIRAVLVKRMREAEERGTAAWLAAAFQEITQLVISILHECWHELRMRKEKTMIPEDQLQEDAGDRGGGIAPLQPAGAPGVLWLATWTLLMTAVIPVTFIAMAPLAVLFMWLINLGVSIGLWPAAQQSTVELFGTLFGFALVLASVQWYLLRRFLPKARLWFLVTGAGVLLGALVVGLSLGRSSTESWDPIWIMAVALLPFGLTLGLAQWLHLRRFLPNAFWIILIDVLAAGSILLAGGAITSAVELMVLLLPGAITGLGLLLLLSQSYSKMPSQVQIKARRENNRRLPRVGRVGLGLAALVPLFFVCSWVYAASQLALAKNEGVYPTVEQAVIANNSRGFGGAEVVRIENVHAAPNSRTAQPHVWFGGATVYLDRVPAGRTWDHYSAGSFYIHVRQGWVPMPEGAFPGFIGWVMELYNMEGVNQ
jgi:hypothetical protein